MAFFDADGNAIVLRIVYDGLAHAGKTTSVRMLGEHLERPCVTPEEARGRTLYFDWLEYSGGTFDGHRVHCQVVTVPGQAVLERRRDYLLGTADAVVYVTSANPHTLPRTVEEVAEILESPNPVPRGVVVQANKRDLPDALPMETIRQAFNERSLRVSVVEATATAGLGIVSAFALAVRLGLDRVAEQARIAGGIEEPLQVHTPEDLLALVRAHDKGGLRRPVTTAPTLSVPDALSNHLPTPAQPSASESSLATDALQEVLRQRHIVPPPPLSVAGSPNRGHLAPAGSADAESIAVQVSAAEAPTAASPQEGATNTAPPPDDDPSLVPLLPTAEAPSGHVWPPVDGRTLLTEALAEEPYLLRMEHAWQGETKNGWLLHSSHDARYHDLHAARTTLVAFARIHADYSTLLSQPRALVLAADGHGAYRIWQVLQQREPIRHSLADSLGLQQPRDVVVPLLSATRQLIQLQHRLDQVASQWRMAATLDTTAADTARLEYVGVVFPSHKTGSKELHAIQELKALLSDWCTDPAPLYAELATLETASQEDREAKEALLALLEEAQSQTVASPGEVG